MVSIDYIMDLLDWNNSKEDQERGVKLAESVKCINVFLQPNSYRYGKNVWDNCAKILSARPVSVFNRIIEMAAGYELAGGFLYT